MKNPHVVIIGGGFGGLAAARALAKAAVTITLIDRRNHHLFQPLLYQVATAALNPSDIAYPIRGVLASQQNVRVLLGDARAIDVAARTVTLEDGLLHYDYLIVATGATHSYFGKDWSEVAPGLKSVEDALEIRRRVFLAYEAAERESDPAAQRDWLTFAVVGAGPTGVELAGALAEIGLHTLANDFRSIDPTQVRVLLFEAGDRVLSAYPPKLSAAAKRSLERRQVEVRLHTKVTAIDTTGVTVGRDGEVAEQIGARTVLWAAGVQASPLGAALGAPRDRAGRVEVAPDLSVPGHPEVFVIGDLAKMLMPDGSQVPGVAQGAIQGGKHVAKVIASEVRGAPKRSAFRYHDKGNMATIGRASAVVATKRFALHGLLAWLLWWVVHIMFLVGFKNRFFVILSWAWSWLSFQRGARLITGSVGVLPPLRAITPDGEPAMPPAAHTVDLDSEPQPEPEQEQNRAVAADR
ncbi:MAG: NAD(P)/FAD-dependent oxidoreductase [Deltaproteobacteria bacterium]|nr:NAD(P)/FAD-dependent oxidoreductase [Deltaproteobacteria bacterium]MDQ3298698.1 NAD(P)/FAD-dependent oxidoreductase [Myxococcota bacterium]